MSNFGFDSLYFLYCVWKVKFIGESVDDCGGGYFEFIVEMCDEFQNGFFFLLIVMLNGCEEFGVNCDCFIFNLDVVIFVYLNMFKFLGVLIGIVIWMGSLLSLNFVEFVWQ